MKITEKNAKGLKREFSVVVSANDMESRINTRLVEVGKNTKMAGFRPGKAPLSVLKQKFGEDVVKEILQAVVNESTRKTLDDKKWRAAQQPAIQDISFEEGKDLEYNVSLEILPEIKPADFTKFKFERLEVDVNDEHVKESLDRLAEERRETKVVEKARPSKMGDVLVIDFQGRQDGEVIKGGDAKDFHLELGSNMLIPGFEEQLVGAKPGDRKKVEVTFPKEYQADELAGKKAEFDVVVRELREYTKTKIDDEFAKALGVTDLKELKKLISEQLAKEFERRAYIIVKRTVLDELDKAHKFELPAGLVETEFNTIWEQLQKELESRGEKPKDKKEMDKLEKDYRSLAERRVRLGLVLAEIGREKKIVVPKQELHQALIQESRRYPGQEKQVFEFYQKNPEAMERLHAPLFEDYVVKYILEKAKVSEKKIKTDDLDKKLSEVTGMN